MRVSVKQYGKAGPKSGFKPRRVSARAIVRNGLASLLLSSAFFASSAAAQTECTGPKSDIRLYVNVTNINAAKGLIAVTLYPDIRSRFLAKRGSLYVGRVPAQAPTTRVCIYVPKAGTYAIAVYHDADSSRKFNRTGVGLPKEGFGFSNNPPVFLGMPAFSRVRIGVRRDSTETTVKLRYP